MSAKKRKYVPIVYIMLVGLVLGACVAYPDNPVPATNTPTSAPPTETPTPEPPTPTPLPPTAVPTVAPVALTTIEDIVGRWEDEDAWILLNEDGRFVSGAPGWQCVMQSWFDGGQLYIEHLSGICCSIGEIGTYEVRGVPGEYLIFTLIEDQCVMRPQMRGTWESATSP
jgi:hypothetical protein